MIFEPFGRLGVKGSQVQILSARPCDVSGHLQDPNLRKWVRILLFLGLVVLGGVDGELAQEFAGGGVDDADVEVLDQQDDVGSGLGSSPTSRSIWCRRRSPART